MNSVLYLFIGSLPGFVTYFLMSLAFGVLFGLVAGHFLATREYVTTAESRVRNQR
jgi:hypothetical protein